MFSEADNIPWNIPHIQTQRGGIFYEILSIPQNMIIDLNTVAP